jgi:crotonobetainyl-CoA:carnitine CoA-transferase CaiB-like acyl-CoA transferase
MAALHALVKDADAVFNNLRGDIPEKMGLTYNALKHLRADIVCAHLSAYGREGERAGWPGYDYLMQAEAGYLSLTGEPDSPPARFGLSMIDLMTGTTAALALVSAVLGARACGHGRDIDVSLFDVSMYNLAYLATWYLNGGHVTGRAARSAHPSLVPSQLYQTRDGWIFIMCNKEKFWPILAEKMGHPEWSERPEFKTFKDRLANKTQFNTMLEAVFLTDTTANWMIKFAGVVPASPVYDVAQALDNPFVHSRQGVINATTADGLSVAGVAAPIRCPGETAPTNAAPALGEHTQSLLKQAGLSDQQIKFLREHSVI